MRASRFDFCGTGWFLLCLALLILPLRWIMAWLISVFAHEAGHLLMLRLCSVPVSSVRFRFGGAVIETGNMKPGTAFLCAAAGPLAGSMLILLGRWMPLVALFAFCHTVWNMIPIPGHDGQRAISALWEMVRNIPCKPAQDRVQ